jgi:hypothetical protein
MMTADDYLDDQSIISSSYYLPGMLVYQGLRIVK